ncbi:type VI secretion system-associated protein TagF [Litoribrevibacter albus]|uniref:type VI secretion system-associated protein TagF n=1 Tax=Litoribrevibacter albus TaxID=1473156 RepID=UPI0024E0B619|nr:type VI secretion system-associated protein TagF [Litoribrevibacter albus]
MPDGSVGASVGICGKIPSRGDFLSQGLPVGFIDSWNEWLQAVLAVSKEQLGGDWLERYLTSPIWHFALSSRVCGESAMAGTFIPSVDQVGRHYPFAVVKEVTQTPIQVWSESEWSEKLEPWILASLDDDFYLEPWLEMLAKEDMSWPSQAKMMASVTPNERSIRGQVIEAHAEGSLSPLGLLHQSYCDLYGRYCLWWTQGSNEVDPCLLVTNGLPQVSQFSAMLDGNWDRWGWTKKQILC